MDPKIHATHRTFKLEFGGELSGLEIAYHTYGKLNPSGDNVVWICHALTANSDAEDWWPGMIGEGCLFDPSRHFIVCANVIGSCYGSTGPLSLNENTGKPYYRAFPKISVRDLVKTHEILREELDIRKIHTVIGASIGGQQALEYAIMYPDIIENLVFIASSAYHSPWAIAFNQSQRLAIEADESFFEDTPEGGKNGLKAARSMALLSYRNSLIYNQRQSEDSDEKTDDFKAISYQNYQGEKLIQRFNAYSYYTLSKLADSHNVGRGRGSKEKALQQIKANTLCIGITSDILYPPEDQKYVAENVPGATYVEIDSLYGHDGFLIEVETLTMVIRGFYQKQNTYKPNHSSNMIIY